MKKLASAIVASALLFAAKSAHAFCGFYVAGADSQLVADASQVVLMREGTRTVLAMQNDYKGPPADFAMVVPVPVVLQKENVKTLPRDVFERVDRLSAPRLVEYWERDPCGKDEGIGLGNIGIIGHGGGTGTGMGFGSGRGESVKVEARFEVGEYEIVILSAKDAAGLDDWLKENHYKIPPGSEPFFRPYVQAGSKFFVAKVNAAKVPMENGVATLSPLRFHYDSDKFELPVRLGLVNSAGKQDLVVDILAPQKRYEVANYPNVTIPTNLDIAESARGNFGEVYAALFDKTLEQNPKAIVTEYAWPAASCDPCPGGSSGLSPSDLVTLGADVLPSVVARGTVEAGASGGSVMREVSTDVKGPLPTEVIQRILRQSYGVFRMCHENALRSNPTLAGNVQTKVSIQPNGEVSAASVVSSEITEAAVGSCVAQRMQRLTFPSADKPTVVTVTFGFTPGGARTNVSLRGSLPAFVLTRLHARYGKDSLGADLVFREAKPIVGGREMPNAAGKLEEGATKSETNSFQARYVIRHSWPGKIECESPKRGVWGGPWPNVDAGEIGAQPATKTAYAPRGRIDVSKMFGNVAAAAAVMPSGVDVDGGQAAPASSIGDAGVTEEREIRHRGAGAKCGCRTPGGDAPSSPFAVFGFALAAVALGRRLICSRSR